MEIALTVAAVVLAGALRGFAGFGAGLVMAPLLGLLLGPRLGVPVIVVLDLLVSAPLLPGAWRVARWRDVLPAGAAAALTIPLGAAILSGADPVLLRRGLSATVLAFVLVLASGWRRRGRPGRLEAAGVGAASGMLTGAGGIGGPPVILWFLTGRDDSPAIRGSLIGYFAVTQTAALAVFGAAGLLTPHALVWSAGLAPPFLLAAHAGAAAFRHAGEPRYRALALSVLAAAALAGLLGR